MMVGVYRFTEEETFYLGKPAVIVARPLLVSPLIGDFLLTQRSHH